MITPLTTAQFFGIFVTYNGAIWPAQIGAYVLGLVAIAALWQRRPKLILAILALMWLWNAIGRPRSALVGALPSSLAFSPPEKRSLPSRSSTRCKPILR